MDEIDRLLRQRDITRLSQVPRPRPVVILGRDANASVTTAPMCLDFDVEFDDAPEGTEAIETIDFDRSSGIFRKQWDDSWHTTCVASGWTREEQLDFVRWQFAPYQACQITIRDSTIVLPAACLGQEHELGPSRRARHLILYMTTDRVLFFSKLVSILTEDQMVHVIAHELGHYYMGHLTAPANLYGFFYRLGAANPTEKPSAGDPEAEALGPDVLTAFRNWRSDQGEPDPRLSEILARAIDFKLARYTYEQEADELSTEWLHELGIDPETGIQALIALSRSWQSRHRQAFGEILPERCQWLSEHGWRDENGADIMVPVADWKDEHHSACFRAFNISREITAHHYDNAALPLPPIPFGPTWEELRADMQEAENRLLPNP